MAELNGTEGGLPVAEMKEHFTTTKDALDDIDKDIAHLIDMKESGKTSDSFDSGALMGMLANKGVDPSLVALMKDRTQSGWGADGGIWLILLFLFLLGGNGFGRGGPSGPGNGAEALGIDRTIFNQSNYDQLMTAVSANGTRQENAISQLAQNLNVDTNTIQTALAGVDKEIAINRGDIKSAIASCCCNIRQEVSNQASQTREAIQNNRYEALQNHNAALQQLLDNKYHIGSQAAETRSLMQQLNSDQSQLIQALFANQNQELQQSFCDQRALILDRFNALELRDVQREIDNKNSIINDLKTQLSQEQQTAALIAALKTSSTSSS